MPESFRAILFDCYGVVVDNTFTSFAAWKRLFEEEGVPLTMVDFQLTLSGGTREKSIRDMIPGVDEVRFNALIDRRRELYSEVAAVNPPEPFPGIVEVIATLKKRGVKTAIASASRHTREDLERLNLVRLFDRVVYHSEDGETDDRSLFLQAMKDLGEPAEQCIIIEDSPRSIRDAKDLGAYLIGIATTVPVEALHRADVIVRGHEELKELLLRLCT